MLPLTLFFIYRYDYSFGSSKKLLFNERFLLFLGRRVQSKNKQLFSQIFPEINFFMKPFLYFLLLNKYTGEHITEERA